MLYMNEFDAPMSIYLDGLTINPLWKSEHYGPMQCHCCICVYVHLMASNHSHLVLLETQMTIPPQSQVETCLYHYGNFNKMASCTVFSSRPLQRFLST